MFIYVLLFLNMVQIFLIKSSIWEFLFFLFTKIQLCSHCSLITQLVFSLHKLSYEFYILLFHIFQFYFSNLNKFSTLYREYQKTQSNPYQVKFQYYIENQKTQFGLIIFKQLDCFRFY
jgi:hypothetical protein